MFVFRQMKAVRHMNIKKSYDPLIEEWILVFALLELYKTARLAPDVTDRILSRIHKQLS